MVTYDKNEKDLVIPSALGLAGMQDSVCGVTEQEVIEIVESAITDYDTEIQVDLEDIRENVSGNTDDIAALSAATEALEQRVDDISTSALTEQIEALSGSVEDIRSDVETLSGDTDNIRSDVAALSAVTSGIAIDVETAWKTEQELRRDLTSLSGRTSAITEQITELSATTSGISADVAALSGITSNIQGDVVSLSGVTEGIATSVGGLSTGLEALSAVTSGLSADMAALEANDNIAFFNLIKDYGNSNEELARLYDGMDAANTAGKTVVVMSNFATGDTLNASVFATFRKDSNGGFYGAGTGVHYDGSTYVASRAVPIFKRDDYFNVIKKDGHFYFKPMGTISPYTLPTSSNSTKGGIKIGSGVTMSGDFLSVKYGDGLGMSGDTLVVSGGTGGGETFVIEDVYGLNTELANFLYQYVDLTNESPVISSAYPAETHILLWLGQDFQGAFETGGDYGYVELYPASVQYDDNVTRIMLTGVYSTNDANSYTVRVGIKQDGYTAYNWVSRINDYPLPHVPAYLNFGNDETGRLRIEFIRTGEYAVYLGENEIEFEAPVQDLCDYIFLEALRTGQEVFTGSNWAFPVNYNPLYQDGGICYTSPKLQFYADDEEPFFTYDDGEGNTIDFYREVDFEWQNYVICMYYAEGNVGVIFDAKTVNEWNGINIKYTVDGITIYNDVPAPASRYAPYGTWNSNDDSYSFNMPYDCFNGDAQPQYNGWWLEWHNNMYNSGDTIQGTAYIDFGNTYAMYGANGKFIIRRYDPNEASYSDEEEFLIQPWGATTFYVTIDGGDMTEISLNDEVDDSVEVSGVTFTVVHTTDETEDGNAVISVELTDIQDVNDHLCVSNFNTVFATEDPLQKDEANKSYISYNGQYSLFHNYSTD